MRSGGRWGSPIPNDDVLEIRVRKPVEIRAAVSVEVRNNPLAAATSPRSKKRLGDEQLATGVPIDGLGIGERRIPVTPTSPPPQELPDLK